PGSGRYGTMSRLWLSASTTHSGLGRQDSRGLPASTKRARVPVVEYPTVIPGGATGTRKLARPVRVPWVIWAATVRNPLTSGPIVTGTRAVLAVPGASVARVHRAPPATGTHCQPSPASVPLSEIPSGQVTVIVTGVAAAGTT